jgi:hypothetical protein
MHEIEFEFHAVTSGPPGELEFVTQHIGFADRNRGWGLVAALFFCRNPWPVL